MEVILAYCLFIIIGALPLIIAFSVMTMPFGALVLWYFSLKFRSFTMFFAGVILISTAAVVIFYSARYLTAQDLDDQDVTKRIENPVLAELKWKRPIPRIFVSGGWNQITPQRLVRAGIVDLVLKQETRRAAGGITEQWKSATVKRNDSCLSALKSDDFQTMSAQKCIEYAPSSGPKSEYILMEETKTYYPRNSSTATIYLVYGGTKTLFATCHAEWPRRPFILPIFEKPFKFRDGEISRRFGQCTRSMLDKLANVRTEAI